MCQNFKSAVSRCNCSPERLFAAGLRLPLPKPALWGETAEISVLSERSKRSIRWQGHAGSVDARAAALRRPLAFFRHECVLSLPRTPCILKNGIAAVPGRTPSYNWRRLTKNRN